jgi:hypothetical protein
LNQGEAFDALNCLADLIENHHLYDLVQGERALQPATLRAQADEIRRKVLEHFVITDAEGTFLSHAVDGLSGSSRRR